MAGGFSSRRVNVRPGDALPCKVRIDVLYGHVGRLDQFAKEHPSQADERFWPLLEFAIKGSPAVPQTSFLDASGGYSETQIPPGASKDDGG